MSKYATGRLRPHFLAVCNPDLDQIQCRDPQRGLPLFVTDYECRGNPKLFDVKCFLTILLKDKNQ